MKSESPNNAFEWSETETSLPPKRERLTFALLAADEGFPFFAKSSLPSPRGAHDEEFEDEVVVLKGDSDDERMIDLTVVPLRPTQERVDVGGIEVLVQGEYRSRGRYQTARWIVRK